MKKLFYLIILGAGIMGCSTDPETLDDLNNLQEVNLTSEVEGFTTTSWEFIKEKKNGNDYFGTLHVTNDCENLYIQLEGGDDLNLGLYEDSESFPTINPNGKVPNGLDYTGEDSENLLWTFPLSDFSGSSISIFANTSNVWVGDMEYGDALYFNYEFQICEIEEICESGYMEGNTPLSEIDNTNKWGWAHNFEFDEDGEITMDILKDDASGNHNPTKLGEVTIKYENETISVTPHDKVEITQLYVSEDRPESSSPGTFDKTQEMSSKTGNFWVIVKAEVCE